MGRKRRTEIQWDASGLVLDIDRFSTHDGPGLRCTVFLKGCPLHCIWCHSPESIGPRPRVLFHLARCVQCGACVAACPHGAQSLGENLERRIDWSRCDHCALCALRCVSQALIISGRRMSVAEIVHTIEPYALFFEHSGGGVTISGGEVTAQPRFALNLLKAFKSRGISTAIETCGFARWRVLSALARCADLVLYDLKQMDREDHRRYTGVGNELILENLGRLARQGVAIQVRVPVMPGYNDSEENIHRTVEYATAVGVRAIAFLPCNPSAGSKYQAMGESFDVRLTPPSKERLAQFAAIASHAGLSAQIEW